MSNDKVEFEYFRQLGWSKKQFQLQLIKEINFGLVLIYDNKIKGFIIGDLITIEKKLEYEILILYVNSKNRRLGYASKLINNLNLFLKKKLKKIFLEVAEDNISAIELYEKNNFKKIGIRKNYYLNNKNRIDALFYQKIINE